MILAVVSRNDPEMIMLAFSDSAMVLKEDDFINIMASYEAKSAQIKLLADKLNLGLNAFVFLPSMELSKSSASCLSSKDISISTLCFIIFSFLSHG